MVFPPAFLIASSSPALLIHGGNEGFSSIAFPVQAYLWRRWRMSSPSTNLPFSSAKQNTVSVTIVRNTDTMRLVSNDLGAKIFRIHRTAVFIDVFPSGSLLMTITSAPSSRLGHTEKPCMPRRLPQSTTMRIFSSVRFFGKPTPWQNSMLNSGPGHHQYGQLCRFLQQRDALFSISPPKTSFSNLAFDLVIKACTRPLARKNLMPLSA